MSAAAKRRKSKELNRLARQPEEAIETSEIPELTDWSAAERGRFYRPVKQQGHATARCRPFGLVQIAGGQVSDPDQRRAAGVCNQPSQGGLKGGHRATVLTPSNALMRWLACFNGDAVPVDDQDYHWEVEHDS